MTATRKAKRSTSGRAASKVPKGSGNNLGKTSAKKKAARKKTTKKNTAKKATARKATAKKATAKKATAKKAETKKPTAMKAEPAPTPSMGPDGACVSPSARPWTVSPEAIAGMSDGELKPILRELIWAEARRSGCDLSGVFVNTEDKAGDDGADAFTPKPTVPCPWLGTAPTCWQFKSGSAGEPAEIAGEVKKRLPRQTLKNKGRFVLVATSSNSGPAGRNRRLRALRDSARSARIPMSKIEVFTSENLAGWLDEHPALAKDLRGMPSGVWSLAFWAADKRHRLAWHGTPAINEAIRTIHEDLDPIGAATITHIHVWGHPGVGKTRFVLEACREAPWRRDVLYVRDGQRTDVARLLERMAGHPNATAVVVVDEARPQDLADLHSLVARADGRVRLLTISLGRALAVPAGPPIAEYQVTPLEETAAADLIASWHPSMPSEHREFAARFCAGYVKLAQVTADALVKNRNLDVHQLLENQHVRLILDSIAGDASQRSSLYVVAALESVGWEGTSEAEGQAIAEHLGLDWNQVRRDVEQLDRKHGIAPRAGRLRYISPRPLGALIAAEAWAAHETLMRSLPERLPTASAKDAYDRRIRGIATAPQVKGFAVEQLGLFFDTAKLTDETGVRRWRALAHAEPAYAVEAVCSALTKADRDERLAISRRARRHLVWGLVEFAWRRDSFHDATTALAHLAVAENETCANNASEEFVRKFQLVLGGTAAPFTERFGLLDELREQTDPEYRVLVVRALGRALPPAGAHRTAPRHDGPTPPEPEWQPSTGAEAAEVALGALQRLEHVARTDESERVGQELARVAGKLVMLLRDGVARDAVGVLIRCIAERSTAAREAMWEHVHGVLSSEKKYWRELGPDELGWIEKLLADLEDNTLLGEIRRALATVDFDSGPEHFAGLAGRVLEKSDEWEAVWRYMNSGDARGSWVLAEAIAHLDAGEFLDACTDWETARDLRGLAGYLSERRRGAGGDWVDDWIDAFFEAHPGLPQLAAEITWRSSSSARGAKRLAEFVHADSLPPSLTELFSYGGWSQTVPRAALLGLVQAMAVSPSHRGSAVVLLDVRAREDAEFWADVAPIALELITDPLIVRRSPNFGFYWHRVVNRLLADDSNIEPIVRSLFAAQMLRDSDEIWLLEHSTYGAQVLSACIRRDAATVWNELVHLLEDEDAARHVVGLPGRLLDRMPQDSVLGWVGVDPAVRGRVIVRSVSKRLEDDSLFVQLIERFGSNKDVTDAASAYFHSGQWTGEASAHWTQLAESLEPMSKRRDLPSFSRWARAEIRSLRAAAKRDREREEERRLRWH